MEYKLISKVLLCGMVICAALLEQEAMLNCSRTISATYLSCFGSNLGYSSRCTSVKVIRFFRNTSNFS